MVSEADIRALQAGKLIMDATCVWREISEKCLPAHQYAKEEKSEEVQSEKKDPAEVVESANSETQNV